MVVWGGGRGNHKASLNMNLKKGCVGKWCTQFNSRFSSLLVSWDAKSFPSFGNQYLVKNLEVISFQVYDFFWENQEKKTDWRKNPKKILNFSIVCSSFSYCAVEWELFLFFP